MEPRKVITFRAIEKVLLPNVNVEKSQQWAKWQVLRKGFQFSAAVDGSAADFCCAGIKKCIGCDSRFPIGIAIMFFDENIDRRKSIMIDFNL